MRQRNALTFCFVLTLAHLSGCATRPAPSPQAILAAMALSDSTDTPRPQSGAKALERADRETAPLAQAINSVDTALEICTQNVANAQTTAYKSVYAIQEPAGRQTFRTNFDQGALESTSRQLDIGISGPGFFKIKLPANSADAYGYTRNGNFFVNKDGDLVLGMGDGYRLVPPIVVPKGTTDITINEDGTLSVTKPGAPEKMQIGQIQLHQFINPQGLNLHAGTIYTQTDQSGPPVQQKPGENGAGQTLQGFLEASNVDLTKEQLHINTLKRWRKAILQLANLQE